MAKYGAVCAVCGFRFDAFYGSKLGAGFIEVHHLKPLAHAGGAYALDPIEDLRPVCSNCHSMLHRRNPPYAIEELIERIAAARKSLA
ncbi:MAG TPA: HNH endonuclease [Tahibacter sp.]|nr:HNH endonuclease [Tahibacter sp.]